MPEKNTPFVKGMLWIGLIFMFAGGAIIWQAIKVGMADESTPRWMGIIFGLLFFNAGVTVGYMDSVFNRFREGKIFSYAHMLAILSIFLIFPLLFNWVAFGSGEREFSMSISIPFLSYDGPVNEILGRVFFAIPALLMDAVIGYLIYAYIVEAYNKKGDEALSAYIGEMSAEED
ncbi:MAG: hypothetical protein HN736_04665 [Anaerolineae bacterium]|jgi:hypothetical protein|nr:hypothetical protein [Anaerolineae bacterium]MBT4310529.1 hypothetical protein [Anaerolineae bacterium]MBT4458959.1 hypothetical protein [Anaerolineae bacterium]MBT4842462.1 hypothetical protein [Anaerolineae bacterium]MBT6060101.1 hypothetical protein [Anaerolineae bacterium]